MARMKKITYYKAVRPDGTDFYTGRTNWAAGEVHHGNPGEVGGRHAGGYFSVSVSPTDCTGMSWPCRLLEVEPIGEAWTPEAYCLPNKRAAHGFRVIRELPASEALGPQGAEIVALVERCKSLTHDESVRLAAARNTASNAAWVAAWDVVRNTASAAARHAAWDAASDAAWDTASVASWDAARDAVWALVVRDLISTEHYDTLTMPWRTTIGPIHPDDK